MYARGNYVKRTQPRGTRGVLMRTQGNYVKGIVTKGCARGAHACSQYVETCGRRLSGLFSPCSIVRLMCACRAAPQSKRISAPTCARMATGVKDRG